MRLRYRCAPLLLSAVLGSAFAGDGLKLSGSSDIWFGPQSEFRLNATLLPSSSIDLLVGNGLHDGETGPAGAAILGDFYFSGLRVAGQPRTGFRASSGLIVHQLGVPIADVVMSGRSAVNFGVASPLNNTAALGSPSAYSLSTVPYIGLGYSGSVDKTGWGYWADVGVVAQYPGNALGLGRVISGSQGIDELVRSLSLSPMIQLGVKYSF